MNDTLQRLIREEGFESTLEVMLEYAETQARLHQSLGDRLQWEFWAKTWVHLQSAADRIAYSFDDQWKEIWNQHLEGYPLDASDFDYPEHQNQ